MRRDNPDRSAKDIYLNMELDGWKVVRVARAVERDKGIPDAMIAKRKIHAVEIKSPGGRLSESQIAFAGWWHPACYHCASSSWELKILLNECEDRDLTNSSRKR